MSLRAKLTDAMKEAMKAKDAKRLATVRLMLAALKDTRHRRRAAKPARIWWAMTKSSRFAGQDDQAARGVRRRLSSGRPS